MSETLAKSGAANIILDETTGANRDYVFIESNLTGATTGDTEYDTSTTWADLGLAGASITNFVGNKDTFGVVDSNDDTVLSQINAVLPSSGSYKGDGRVYLDLGGTYDLDSVSEIRNYIGDTITEMSSNIDIAFLLMEFEGDNTNLAMYHTKWTGSLSDDPTASSSDLHVTRLAVFNNVSDDSVIALSSGNVIQTKYFIGKELHSSL